jgi:insertion element IS1 protein InsB
VVAWEVGDRSDGTLKTLLNRVGMEGVRFASDDWGGYQRCIPDDQLYTGKDLTYPLEQETAIHDIF